MTEHTQAAASRFIYCQLVKFVLGSEYTVCLKKTILLTFDNNLGKCRLIFKILSLTDSLWN